MKDVIMSCGRGGVTPSVHMKIYIYFFEGNLYVEENFDGGVGFVGSDFGGV